MYISLHNHTDHSLLASLIRVEALAARARQCGMPAVAITDTATLAGALELRRACMAAGVKALYGMEALVLVDDGEPDRVVLLAENNTGWRNLIALSSIACTTGATRRGQCVTREQLRDLRHGLIALSAGHEGRIHAALQSGRNAEARGLAAWYADTFGRESFFLEIQPHMPEAAWLQRASLARELHVGLVLTTDSRMLTPDGAEALDVLACMREGLTISRLSRRHVADQHLFLSPEEAQKRCAQGFESAIANTQAIAGRCAADPAAPPQLPRAPLPEGFADPDTYLRHLCEQGLAGRGPTAQTVARLEHELQTITRRGLAGWFLILAEIVAESRRLGIPHAARGAANGSIVCWALGITDVDPVAEGLFFEKFIPEALPRCFPDIGIEFPPDGRRWAVEHLARRYGSGALCRVAAYSRIGQTTALRHASRALEIDSAIAPPQRHTMDNGQDRAARLSHCAKLIEGLIWRAGTHGCGVVIAPGPVHQFLPVRLPPAPAGDSMPCAQWDTDSIRDCGCARFDFLSLTALSVLAEGARLVRLNRGVNYTCDCLDKADKATRQMLDRAETTGVFQLESDGMQDYLRKLGEAAFDDIVAFIALYRPGPLESLDDYIPRRKGKAPVPLVHPVVDRVLAPTLGVLVYQEQLMAIACELGGLSAAEADALCRALAMRREDQCAELSRRLVSGAVAHGMSARDAEEYFGRLLRVAGYCFTKAQALSYARLAWRLAQLKANHPAEFLLASLNAWIDSPDELALLAAEAVHMSIEVRPPDVNASEAQFAFEGPAIRAGLLSLQGLGQTAARIANERREHGPYRSVFDLCARVRLSSRQLTGLIAAGALSSLPGSRAEQFGARRAALAWGRKPDPDHAVPGLPHSVDCLDVLREIVSLNREAIADLSFDVYRPATYRHHPRLTVWMSPGYFLQRTELRWLVSRLQPAIAALRPPGRDSEYTIGLNSRVDQYSERQLLLLDLDHVEGDLPERLRELGGYLLSSGRGMHFIGRRIIETRQAWDQLMTSLLDDETLLGALDYSHMELSLKRGYATLRVLESPTKPVRPRLVRRV